MTIAIPNYFFNFMPTLQKTIYQEFYIECIRSTIVIFQICPFASLTMVMRYRRTFRRLDWLWVQWALFSPETAFGKKPLSL